ncbi:uncharacterized protein LOC135120317 isoform X2 [Zophobas morio]|uniref:uncharacterized protein LOC135120317 isoform X2 n=1 Tax=Zophobas morio TaxID=2755281 RepID=UPI003083D50B
MLEESAALLTIREIFEIFYNVLRFWAVKSLKILTPNFFQLFGVLKDLFPPSNCEVVKVALQTSSASINSYTSEYDHLEATLKELEEAHLNKNLSKFCFLLQTEFLDLLRSMGNSNLNCAKNNFLKYTDKVSILLRELSYSNSCPRDLLINFYENIRLRCGRSALLLSGGGLWGIFHVGVVKVLFFKRLLPKVISGSSAGAIVAAIICTKTHKALKKFLKQNAFEFRVFEKKVHKNFYFEKLKRLIQEGALADQEDLRAAVRYYTEDLTFLEAHYLTGRILNISVTCAGKHGRARLLNHLTAPNIVIWSAVCASCALPAFYRPVRLHKKINGGRVVPCPFAEYWSDGSLECDIPSTRLSVSQVNPHIVPFVHPSSPFQKLKLAFPSALDVTLLELKRRLIQLKAFAFGNFIASLLLILDQPYTGNTTIVPTVGIGDFINLFRHPSATYITKVMKMGEKNTKTEIKTIELRSRVERTISNILLRLKRENSKV